MRPNRTLAQALSLLLLSAPAAGRDLCFADSYSSKFVVIQ